MSRACSYVTNAGTSFFYFLFFCVITIAFSRMEILV